MGEGEAERRRGNQLHWSIFSQTPQQTPVSNSLERTMSHAQMLLLLQPLHRGRQVREVGRGCGVSGSKFGDLMGVSLGESGFVGWIRSETD